MDKAKMTSETRTALKTADTVQVAISLLTKVEKRLIGFLLVCPLVCDGRYTLKAYAALLYQCAEKFGNWWSDILLMKLQGMERDQAEENFEQWVKALTPDESMVLQGLGGMALGERIDPPQVCTAMYRCAKLLEEALKVCQPIRAKYGETVEPIQALSPQEQQLQLPWQQAGEA